MFRMFDPDQDLNCFRFSPSHLRIDKTYNGKSAKPLQRPEIEIWDMDCYKKRFKQLLFCKFWSKQGWQLKKQQNPLTLEFFCFHFFFI